MAESTTADVPRTPEKPSPQEVLKEMDPCEPYTTKDLVDAFEDDLDTSRWTMQRRLETLVENGELEKKKHAENRVSYWIASE